jgi:hypothetical protein
MLKVLLMPDNNGEPCALSMKTSDVMLRFVTQSLKDRPVK